MTHSEQEAVEKYLNAVQAFKDFNDSLHGLNEDAYDTKSLMQLNKIAGYVDMVITALDRIGDLIRDIIPPAKS